MDSNHLEYVTYSPSQTASKSKSSPTDALEFDTFEGTRSQLSDLIRLWIARRADQMKALVLSFTRDIQTCEIYGLTHRVKGPQSSNRHPPMHCDERYRPVKVHVPNQVKWSAEFSKKTFERSPNWCSHHFRRGILRLKGGRWHVEIMSSLNSSLPILTFPVIIRNNEESK